jgi:hypothetical protein
MSIRAIGEIMRAWTLEIRESNEIALEEAACTDGFKS